MQRKKVDDGDTGARGWRSKLLEDMRQVANSPDIGFPKACRAVLEPMERRQAARLGSPTAVPAPESGAHGDPRFRSVEDRVANPCALDRVVALAFFFQAAAFVRVATPQILASISDQEIRFLALCLGVETASSAETGGTDHAGE
jgi:hypothetical protein